jgi:hypothetical protein
MINTGRGCMDKPLLHVRSFKFACHKPNETDELTQAIKESILLNSVCA